MKEAIIAHLTTPFRTKNHYYRMFKLGTTVSCKAGKTRLLKSETDVDRQQAKFMECCTGFFIISVDFIFQPYCQT